MWDVGQLAAQPVVDGVGFVGAVMVSVSDQILMGEQYGLYIPSNEVVSHRSTLRLSIGSNSWVEEEQNRGSLEHELSKIST